MWEMKVIRLRDVVRCALDEYTVIGGTDEWSTSEHLLWQ